MDDPVNKAHTSSSSEPGVDSSGSCSTEGVLDVDGLRERCSRPPGAIDSDIRAAMGVSCPIILEAN